MRRENAKASGASSDTAGFTLVEMAVCLCIIGLLMSGGLAGLSRYMEAQRVGETRVRVDFVMNMLGAYAQAHYRLPCPADPKASPDQAGREENDGQCSKSKGEL